MIKMFRRIPLASAIAKALGVVANAWDPARIPSAFVLSNSNKTVERTTGSAWATGFALNSLPTDKKTVWECVLDSATGPSVVGFSVATNITGYASGYIGQNANQGGVYWTPGQGGLVMAGTGITKAATGLGEFAAGDVIAFGWDPILGTMKVWRNGVALNSGNPVWTGMIGKVALPAISLFGAIARVTIRPTELQYSYSGYNA